MSPISGQGPCAYHYPPPQPTKLQMIQYGESACAAELPLQIINMPKDVCVCVYVRARARVRFRNVFV